MHGLKNFLVHGTDELFLNQYRWFRYVNMRFKAVTAVMEPWQYNRCARTRFLVTFDFSRTRMPFQTYFDIRPFIHLIFSNIHAKIISSRQPSTGHVVSKLHTIISPKGEYNFTPLQINYVLNRFHRYYNYYHAHIVGIFYAVLHSL